jgi:hypothetical protein
MVRHVYLASGECMGGVRGRPNLEADTIGRELGKRSFIWPTPTSHMYGKARICTLARP